MANAQPAHAARSWDKIARKYAKNKIGDMPGYERSISRALELLDKKDVVLELGCGTGTTGLQYAPHVGQYIGTDISPEMIAICQEKLTDTDFKNVMFKVMSADDLPFENAHFSAVIAHNLYHLVPDLDKALGEARRVLQKGGLFITKTPCLGEMSWPMRKLIVPVMAKIYGFSGLNMLTQEAWIDAINSAEFTVEAVEFHGSKGKDMRPFIIARRP